MPISRKRRPLALIVGQVIGKEPRQEYANGAPTGNTARYDVTILQSSFATPDVRFPLGPNAVRVPEDGERVALIVDMGETDEYGANLRAVRFASEEDLAAIAEHMPALASK